MDTQETHSNRDRTSVNLLRTEHHLPANVQILLQLPLE